MKYIQTGNEEDRKLLFSKIPWSVDTGDGIVLRVMGHDNKIKGLISYDGYTGIIKEGIRTNEGGNVFLSVVGFHHTFFLKNTARCILLYPFQVLKCDRVTTITPIFNTRAIRINKAFGFQFEGLLKNFIRYDGNVSDAVIYALQKEEAQERGFC